jgi:hypothetical protein
VGVALASEAAADDFGDYKEKLARAEQSAALPQVLAVDGGSLAIPESGHAEGVAAEYDAKLVEYNSKDGWSGPAKTANPVGLVRLSGIDISKTTSAEALAESLSQTLPHYVFGMPGVTLAMDPEQITATGFRISHRTNGAQLPSETEKCADGDAACVDAKLASCFTAFSFGVRVYVRPSVTDGQDPVPGGGIEAAIQHRHGDWGLSFGIGAAQFLSVGVIKDTTEVQPRFTEARLAAMLDYGGSLGWVSSVVLYGTADVGTWIQRYVTEQDERETVRRAEVGLGARITIKKLKSTLTPAARVQFGIGGGVDVENRFLLGVGLTLGGGKQ